ncbi:MAG: hypothetical protein JW703_00365 [Candidatus Diapherotrites archaeon]|nr:hypothetical protein [Candidatus Diapherotrites archaeon]
MAGKFFLVSSYAQLPSAVKNKIIKVTSEHFTHTREVLPPNGKFVSIIYKNGRQIKLLSFMLLENRNDVYSGKMIYGNKEIDKKIRDEFKKLTGISPVDFLALPPKVMPKQTNNFTPEGRKYYETLKLKGIVKDIVTRTENGEEINLIELTSDGLQLIESKKSSTVKKKTGWKKFQRRYARRL